MQKYIFICDRCEKKLVTDRKYTPEGWNEIVIYIPSSSDFDGHCKGLLFCPDCTDRLGLYYDRKKTKINVKDEATRNKLFKLFEDFMAEAMRGK